MAATSAAMSATHVAMESALSRTARYAAGIIERPPLMRTVWSSVAMRPWKAGLAAVS